jgi:hypothetical protein
LNITFAAAAAAVVVLVAITRHGSRADSDYWDAIIWRGSRQSAQWSGRCRGGAGSSHTRRAKADGVGERKVEQEQERTPHAADHEPPAKSRGAVVRGRCGNIRIRCCWRHLGVHC